MILSIGGRNLSLEILSYLIKVIELGFKFDLYVLKVYIFFIIYVVLIICFF